MEQQPYNGLSPFERGSDTFYAAAVVKRPTAATQRRFVYRYLLEHGPRTQEALSAETGIEGNSARPRLRELVLLGWVMDSGLRHPTRSGRYAVVWQALEGAELVAEEA